MPVDLAALLLLACASAPSFARKAHGCGLHPAFPAPSVFRGTRTMQNPDGFPPRECGGSSLVVIARSQRGRAFARTRWLAMATMGCLKFESEDSTAQGRELQLHLPGLACEIDAKAVMLLLGDAAEADTFVDAARGDQDALGPQRHPLVAFLARGADALLDQSAADAEPARFFFDQQQAQLGEFVGGIDQEDRAERLAVRLRDPAMLARGIVGLDELCADLGDQRLVRDVPAIVLGIGDRLPRDHPAHVADRKSTRLNSSHS